MSQVANHIKVRHTTTTISGANGPRCSHMIYSFVVNAAMPTINRTCLLSRVKWISIRPTVLSAYDL